jgi:hypothetical protein
MLTKIISARLQIVLLCLFVILLMSYMVILYSSSIQDSIIINATENIQNNLPNYTDHDIILLMKEGYYSIFTTNRSMCVINKNINNDIRKELNYRISIKSNLTAYLQLRNYQGYYLGGNTFSNIRVKELVDPILLQYGH